MTEINRAADDPFYDASFQEALKSVECAIRREKNRTVTESVKFEQESPSLEDKAESLFHQAIFPDKMDQK